MIIKHSTDDSPKPKDASLRLARVVSIGNGTVDVSPVGSSVVLHEIPLTALGVSVGDTVNLQMIDNKRFAIPQLYNADAAAVVSSASLYSAVSSGGSSSTGSSEVVAAHGISDTSIHTGTLATSQAPWAALKTTAIVAGNGLSGGGSLSSNVTLSINTGSALTWTALQKFNAGMEAATGSFGRLSATGDATLAAISAASGLTVTGNTIVQNFTGSGVVVNGPLSVTGNSALAALTAANAIINGTLAVTGSSTLAAVTGSTGVFTGLLSGQSGLNVTGNAVVNGALSVTGGSTLAAVTGTTGVFTGLLSGQSGLNITGSTVIQNATASNTLINGTLSVTGNSTLAAVTGTTGVFTGLLSGQSGLNVTGNTVIQNATANNTLINGTLMATGSGTVGGLLSGQASLAVTGYGNFSTTLQAQSDITSVTGGFYGSSLNGYSSGVSGALSITSGGSTNITLNPGGFVSLASGKSLQSHNFSSQTTGMRITNSGEGDFRYLFADELHAKSFIADLEQALAGGQIISKSVAMLADSFTIPATGASAVLAVADLPSAPNMQVFQANDVVGVRTFSRANGGLDVSWAYGTVTNPTTGAGIDSKGRSYQTWTFTRLSGSNGGNATGGKVPVDSLALDFGTSGNGFHEINAIDGLYGANSPYSQVVTWTGNPSNRTVRTRIGNINGITSVTGFDAGFYAGDGASATSASSSYIRLSALGTEFRNIPVGFYNSNGNRVISIVPSPTATAQGPYLSIGTTNAPTGYLGANQSGFWVGSDSGTAKFWLGAISQNGTLNSGISWDGSTLTVSGTINVQSGNAATQAYATGVASSASGNAYASATGYANNASANANSVATGYALNNVYASATGYANNASANAYTLATGDTSTQISRIISTTTGLIALTPSPAGSGLFLSSTAMGHYSSGQWATFIGNNGDFVFREPFAANSTLSGIRWTSGTGVLEGGSYATNATGYSTFTRQWSTDGTNGMIMAGGGFVTLGASGFSSYNSAASAAAGVASDLNIRLGLLNGTYGYSTSIYGFAAGASANTYLTAESTNGFRVMNNGVQYFQIASGGSMTIGRVAANASNVTIDSTNGILMRNNTTTMMQVATGGNMIIGATGTGTTNSWVTIDTTDGFVIKNGLYNTFQADTDGTVKVGAAGSGKSMIQIDTSNGVQILNNTSRVFQIATGGGVTIGATGTGAASNWITIDSSNGFAIRNGSKGSVITMDTSGNASIAGVLNVGTSGGIYQGTGTFASPTTGLKIWTDSGVGRIAGYNSGTAQWYAGTDGSFYAGQGSTKIDSNGIQILNTNSSFGYTPNMIQFFDGLNPNKQMGAIYGTLNASTRNLVFSCYPNPGDLPSFPWPYAAISASYNGTTTRQVRQEVGSFTGVGQVIDSFTSLTTSGFFVSSGLNVGSATGAATGEIKASAGISGTTGTFTGGLNVGTATGAGTGDVCMSGSLGIGTTSPSGAADIRGTWRQQLTIGAASNAGSLALRRGSDGLIATYIGYAAASEASELRFQEGGGGGYMTWHLNRGGGGVSEVMRISNAGVLSTFAGYSVPTSTGSALFSFDASSGNTLSATSNGNTTNGPVFYPFGQANNFSGLLLVTNTTNNALGVFAIGGNSITMISDSQGGTYSSGNNTASRINVFLSNPGSGNTVTIQNNVQSTRTLRVVGIRMGTAA